MITIINYFDKFIPNCGGVSPNADGYRLDFNDGTSRQATPEEILQAQRLMLVDQVWSTASRLLDAQAAGYSIVEVAQWPFLVTEVTAYLSSGVVGPYMQAVVDRGRHTAETLATMLLPKMQYQRAVFAARDAHLTAIEACQDLMSYDVNALWP